MSLYMCVYIYTYIHTYTHTQRYMWHLITPSMNERIITTWFSEEFWHFFHQMSLKNRETELNADLPAGPPVKKTAENVLLDIISIVVLFRYSKLSGFLKQKPFLRAGVSMITWLWKWVGKFAFCILLGESYCDPSPSSDHLLCYRSLHLSLPTCASLMSVPRVVENFSCCDYAFNSWAAYASLIKGFLLMVKLFLG